MNTKTTFILFAASGFFAAATASETESETFAEKMQTKVEADAVILEIESKLTLEGAEIAPDSDQAALQIGVVTPASASEETDDEEEEGAPPEHELVLKMKALRDGARLMSGKLKALKDDAFRQQEIADWNAKHDEVKALLFQVFQKAENGEISDDLAPILEEIRKQFQIDAAAPSGS